MSISGTQSSYSKSESESVILIQVLGAIQWRSRYNLLPVGLLRASVKWHAAVCDDLNRDACSALPFR
jgi:hypothetical protein